MVPREMRSLDQWCCSTADSKVPIDAKTGNAAAVNDPSTWSSYTRAVEAGYPFVGFVLSDSDPFTIIDLDPPDTKEQEDRHAKIIAALDSYTEVSKSGRGVHIIVTGSIPKGVRRDKVEIYSSHRYMITTGKSIGDRPIANRQRLLDIMFREMDTTATVELVEEDEVISDEEVVEMAMSASNADKFNRLCRGEWQGEYSSQSDADFALLAIIAYYTRSNSQVRRLFRMSALGKRDKAHRPDYLNRSLMKIRAKQPAVLDFSELDLTVPEEEIEREPYVSDFVCDQQYPSGLMGEIANYIYNTAQRPIHEAGIAASIGLMAGITGRAYNVSHTGLNQYLVLLAGTGSGKEGMASGISRLLLASRETIPMADSFIGPGVFASGQAILKILPEKPCFVSLLGEIGLTLQQICDPRANGANKMLLRVLLDLYSKSGHGEVLHPMVYSDNTKNTLAVHSPCVTILGESTPSEFFDNLSLNQITQGLIPRFSILEYCGRRPGRNRNSGMPPHPHLVEKINALILSSMSVQQNNQTATVLLSSDAQRLMDDFDEAADSQMKNANLEIELQLWNRAHLKALKLSALIAIGHNIHDPVVSKADAEWAISFVRGDVESILNRFSDGAIGSGEERLEHEVVAAIKAYSQMPHSTKMKTYCVSKELVKYPALIPYNYLRRKCMRLAAFKNDRRGESRALQEVLNQMVDADVLIQVSPRHLAEKYGTRAKCYQRSTAWRVKT
jgi:hypothetical protein